MQTASKLIDATVTAVGGTQRSERLDVTVTISNRGKKDTPVSVWVEPRPNDPDSQNLLTWWERDPNSILSVLVDVERNGKNDAKLSLQIPDRAKSILYHYDIWISAHEYPELKFLRLEQQLQVVPPADKDFKPKFSIVEPVMTRQQPYPIVPGESATVVIRVENRSGIVDRFRLECDLDPTWYQVVGSEGGPVLFLNPNINHIGDISLVLTPPTTALAGLYSPTIRLFSKVSDRSSHRGAQIDILYFEILPQGDPQLQLEPVERHRPGHLPTISAWGLWRQTRQFRAAIVNQANTRRTPNLEVYPLPNSALNVRLTHTRDNPTPLDLEPWERWEEPIEVQLRRWRPPLRRKDKTLAFEVTLTDPHDDRSELPTLRGEVVWRRTPWWVWLLLLLAVLGAIGWLLWLCYVLPPAPKIETFKADRADGDDILKSTVFLNFTVKNPENLGSVMLTYLDAAGQRTSNRFDRQTIASSENLPPGDLPAFLSPQSEESQKNSFKLAQCSQIQDSPDFLNCQFRVENLPPANDYSFELQVFPTPAETLFGIRKRDATQPTDTQLTESVPLLPIPPLQIHNLKSAAIANPRNVRKQIVLTWDIHNIQTLEKLNIIQTEAQGQSEIYTYPYRDEVFSLPEDPTTEFSCIPIEENPFSLRCTWTLDRQLAPSQYKYRIEVFSRQNPQEAADTRETQNTLVFTPPKLDRFAAVDRPYTGGENPILFDFAIENPRQVKALVLRAIDARTGRGRELQRYDFLSDGDNFLPPDLQSCQLGTLKDIPQLVCRNLPTQPLAIGEYQFELVAISRASGGSPITLSSDAIVVRPPSAGDGDTGGDRALTQIDFKVNGQPVGNNPTTFLFPLNPNGTPTILNLAWDIKGVENRNLQVSLSPVLATADVKGSLKVTLQGTPDPQTFTLQVTNELGEVETRTALVQTYSSTSPATPVPSPSERSGGVSPSKLSPPPSDPENLRPLEVPPILD